jgi:hypothetical protein
VFFPVNDKIPGDLLLAGVRFLFIQRKIQTLFFLKNEKYIANKIIVRSFANY